MNFRSISEIFKRVSLTNTKMPLGRWNNHNYNQTTLKIKYATEDNCGISHNNYKNTDLLKQNDDLEDENYVYMMGYESVH